MEQTAFPAELLHLMLGGMTPAYLLAAMLFVAVGALLNIGLDIYNRDERSLNTPVAFSWAFFIKSNWMRLLFNILAAYSVVRLFSDIYPGLKISMFWAWIIGLAFDWIWVVLREVKYMAIKKLKNAINNWKK